MCGCKRKRMLGFFLMERHESVRTVFEFVYRHFKVAPRIIVYDNGTPVLHACMRANENHTNPLLVKFHPHTVILAPGINDYCIFVVPQSGRPCVLFLCIVLIVLDNMRT